jgi:hypothetical protein
MKLLINDILNRVPGRTYYPQAIFHSNKYLPHNQRHLEHSASSGLPIAGPPGLRLLINVPIGLYGAKPNQIMKNLSVTGLVGSLKTY